MNLGVEKFTEELDDLDERPFGLGLELEPGWDNSTSPTTTTSPQSQALDFNCRICFKPATDPSVTQCGHLFCWQEINQWLRSNTRCPTCQTPCTISDIVPINADTQPASSPTDSSCQLPSPPTTPPVFTTLRSPTSDDLLSQEDESDHPSLPDDDSDDGEILRPHPIMAQHIFAQQFSRVLSIVALSLLLKVLLK